MRLTPQQNGLAEKMNRTLMDKFICMFVQSQLPKCLQAETLLNACYLVNLSPSITLDYKIRFELWHGKLINFDSMRVFAIWLKFCLNLAGLCVCWYTQVEEKYWLGWFVKDGELLSVWWSKSELIKTTLSVYVMGLVLFKQNDIGYNILMRFIITH